MSERDPDKTLKVLGDLSETAIHEIAGIVKAMYAASKASRLMSITSALFTADFLQKLGIMYPATADGLRQTIFQAIGFSFRSTDLANQAAWETLIPGLGFLVPGHAIELDTILGTTLNVDATGGEQIIKEAITQAGGIATAEEKTQQARLAALTKLLEKVPAG